MIRSVLFIVWLYGSMAFFAVGCSPTLLMPHRYAMGVVKAWAHTVLFGLRWIAGVRIEVRGLQYRPTGAALVAPKHQGMLDIIVPFTVLDDPCFVLKKELMAAPFLGWFAWKTGMIPVDRAAGSAALKSMVRTARERLAQGRQIVIFPEGTRTAPGALADYKPGVAAIYRELDSVCVPVATNSGVHWPAHGVRRYPGTAVFEFLEPLPAAMKRAPFMALLESRIEARSANLLEPAKP